MNNDNEPRRTIWGETPPPAWMIACIFAILLIAAILIGTAIANSSR